MIFPQVTTVSQHHDANTMIGTTNRGIHSVNARVNNAVRAPDDYVPEGTASKAQWITFEFGGLFDWLCLVLLLLLCRSSPTKVPA